jgi:hypothetical protein
MSKPAPRNLRVVIFCLGIETVKHIAPLKYFGADKAYMLYLERKSLFQVFRTEVSKQANKILREGLVEVEVKVYDFTKTMACLLEIVKKEKAAGNIVYMNLDGPPNYAAAAMITAMMEDCETFYTPTADHQITDIKMFQGSDGTGTGAQVPAQDAARRSGQRLTGLEGTESQQEAHERRSHGRRPGKEGPHGHS